jgi:small subunit ribosomal protein S18
MDKRRDFKKYPVEANCLFCEEKKDVDYKDVEVLKKFLNDRGRIVSRSRSGVCAKHQRRLAKALKRARFLALLPFLSKVN